MRCVDIVTNTIGVNKKDAEVSLIRAIYRNDQIDDEMLLLPRSVHIKKSILSDEDRNCSQICLPLALMIATGKWTVRTAEDALKVEPR